jgi:release factor glutamine methyltransferase
MKYSSNKVKDIRRYFRENLAELYSQNEIDAIFFILVEEYTNCSKAQFLADPELTINESELLKIHHSFKELIKSKPAQYITGKAFFCNDEFFVKPGVLIPRPETEELVDLIIRENSVRNNLTILDIGTGSGCIAIELKKHFSNAEVIASDIFRVALEVASNNAICLKTEIHFIQDDILHSSFNFPMSDIIISNPPYIKESEKKLMNRNVLDYEPEEALFVPDEKHLLFYNAIADFAKKKLKKDGKLYFEINESHADEVCLLLEEMGFTMISIHKDINNKDRMISCGI